MRRNPISFIVLILALALLASCAGGRTAALLDDIESYIQERPDSALAAIRSIDTTTLTTRSLRAHYALLHAMALDKNWIDTTDVDVVMPAVEYYDRHPSGLRRSKAWYYLGRIQQNAGNYPDATLSLLKSELYSDEIADNAFTGQISMTLSSIYSQLHLHEEALSYAGRAYSIFEKINDEPKALLSMLAKAQNYYSLARYIEADFLFCQLIENNHFPAEQRNALLCDYALSCVTQGKDFCKAIAFFEEVVSGAGRLDDLNYLGAYAYASLREGNVQQSERLFNQLGEFGGVYSAQVYAYWKSLADAYMGNFSSSFQLQAKVSHLQNGNVKKSLRQYTTKAKAVLLDEMNHEAERVSRHRKFVIGCLIVSMMVIVSLMTFYLWRRNKQTAREKGLLVEAFNELTCRADEEKAKVRSQYIRMCQCHFSHIGRINEILHNYSSNSDNRLYQELKSSMKTIGSDEQNQREFEKLLDDSFDNVMTHFRESFPNKKPRFYQLVSFLFAGFNTASICAIIPDYNKHNVHVEKSRIKKMIQGSDSSHKEHFLQLIM